jgi:hypothetical protein
VVTVATVCAQLDHISISIYQAQLWCSRLQRLSQLAGFDMFAECLRVLTQRFGNQSAKVDVIDSELLSLPGVQVTWRTMLQQRSS